MSQLCFCSASSSAVRMRQTVHRPARRTTCQVRATVTAERQSLDISKMEPLNDRVLVKPIVEARQTVGGILLPGAPPKQNSDAHFGEVISVGADVKLPLSKGDKIIYMKYAVAEVEVPQGEILFVAEKSIWGVLEA